MQRHLYALAAIVLLCACGPSNNSNGSSGSSNNGGNNGGTGDPAVVVDTSLFASNPELVRAAALPGGGVAVAGLNASFEHFLAAFDRALEPLWALTLPETGVPVDLVVDSNDQLVLSASTSGVPVAIMRFDPADGALIDSAGFDGLSPADLVPLDDGGLVLSSGVALDSNLEVTWVGEASGERIAPAGDGGYLLANSRETAGGGTGSGITLRKVDAEGKLQWKSYASPGPGRHGIAGLRTFDDGRIIVGLANDSGTSRNQAVLSPLVVSIFGADGTVESSRFFTLSTTNDGRRVPLQFGGALDLAARGATTFVSVVANSGALGDDIRAQPTIALDSDGNPTGVTSVGGSVAVGSSGDVYLVNSGGRLGRASDVSDVCGRFIVDIFSESFEAVTDFTAQVKCFHR